MSSHLETDLSPNAMADKAFAAAIADRKRRHGHITSRDDRIMSGKRVIVVENASNPNDKVEKAHAHDQGNIELGLDEDSEPEKQLESIWNKVTLSSIIVTTPQDDDHVHESKLDMITEKAHEATEYTNRLVQRELESFFREGLEAFHKCDSILRQLHQTKELCDARGKELLRLQTSESESKHLVSVSSCGTYCS